MVENVLIEQLIVNKYVFSHKREFFYGKQEVSFAVYHKPSRRHGENMRGGFLIRWNEMKTFTMCGKK